MAGTHTHTLTLTYEPSFAQVQSVFIEQLWGLQESLPAHFALWSTRRNHYENNTRFVFLAVSLSFSARVCASLCVYACVGVYLICMNAVEGLCVNDFVEECVGRGGGCLLVICVSAAPIA